MTMTIVETVADLLAIAAPSDGQMVRTKRYRTLSKSGVQIYLGGGVYIYNSQRANENDGGLVLNGWVRQDVGGTVYLEWFGATQGDYTYDSAALLNAAASGYSIQLAKAMYSVNTPVTFANRGQAVYGCGAMSGFLLGSGSNNFFTFTKLAEDGTTVLSGGGMSDLRIEANNRTGGYVLDIFKANTQVFNNIIIKSAYGAVICRKFNSLMFSNCLFSEGRGSTLFYADGTNYRSDLLKFNFCTISGSNNYYDENEKPTASSPVNIRIVGNIHTVQANTLLSLGSRIAFFADSCSPSSVAVDADNVIGTTYTPAFIRIRNFESDFAYQRTIVLSACNDVTFSDSYIHGAQTDCNVWVGTAVSALTFENCRVTSAAKQGYLLAGKNIKIIAGDVGYSSHQYPGEYAAIEVKPGAKSIYCMGVNTGYYYSSSTIYQKYGLSIYAGAENVQFIGGELAGTTSAFYDATNGTTNVIVKDYITTQI